MSSSSSVSGACFAICHFCPRKLKILAYRNLHLASTAQALLQKPGLSTDNPKEIAIKTKSSFMPPGLPPSLFHSQLAMIELHGARFEA